MKPAESYNVASADDSFETLGMILVWLTCTVIGALFWLFLHSYLQLYMGEATLVTFITAVVACYLPKLNILYIFYLSIPGIVMGGITRFIA